MNTIHWIANDDDDDDDDDNYDCEIMFHRVGHGVQHQRGVRRAKIPISGPLRTVVRILQVNSTSYDKESGEGYKSVPLRHQNSDASQDALKLVPDSSF